MKKTVTTFTLGTALGLGFGMYFLGKYKLEIEEKVRAKITLINNSYQEVEGILRDLSLPEGVRDAKVAEITTFVDLISKQEL